MVPSVSDRVDPLKPEGGDLASLRRRLFLVTAEDTPDALMRVLGVASVQQARLRALFAVPEGAHMAIRLEIDDQGDDRAQVLASRLAACPSVRGVGFGWRQ